MKDHNKPTQSKPTFETLDPENWETTRALLHKMVDDALDYTRDLRDRPTWQEMPPSVKADLQEPLPQVPSDAASVYDQFKDNVLPYHMGNVHPRFWAWYMGSGTVSGFMGDFWASVLNPNLGGGNHSGNMVESQVIQWIIEMVDFPSDSSGLLVSGGSMANFTALAVARNAQSGYDMRAEGIRAEDVGKFLFYSSTETHSCNQKALELLGLGAKSMRYIPVNEDYTINITLLKNQIMDDKRNGLKPLAIIGNSGTINTGAIDDLDALADICERESMWFHVDGAIGAIAILADNVRPQLSGMNRADSIALDLHKWMHMPFEAGCVVMKNQKAHKATFSVMPAYLEKQSRGLGSGENWYSEFGLQLSRRFRALKIWMSLKEHGSLKFGRMIARNVDQANYLGELIFQHEKLELCAPIGLDIVCFRYSSKKMTVELHNQINQEIKLEIEEKGMAVLGYTTLEGKYCLRIAIANHRSTTEDFDLVLEEIVQIGERLEINVGKNE